MPDANPVVHRASTASNCRETEAASCHDPLAVSSVGVGSGKLKGNQLMHYLEARQTEILPAADQSLPQPSTAANRDRIDRLLNEEHVMGYWEAHPAPAKHRADQALPQPQRGLQQLAATDDSQHAASLISNGASVHGLPNGSAQNGRGPSGSISVPEESTGLAPAISGPGPKQCKEASSNGGNTDAAGHSRQHSREPGRHRAAKAVKLGRAEQGPAGPLPLLVSSCPGWVVYAEKTHGSYILPYLSTAKSPQAITLPSLLSHILSCSICTNFHLKYPRVDCVCVRVCVQLRHIASSDAP